MTKIFIGSDHAGFELKSAIHGELLLEYTITDCGTNSTDSVDYPIFAHEVAKNVLLNTGSIGVLICATGIGMSIAANRHRGIRAALCRGVKDVKLARHHNNANVLVIGATYSHPDEAVEMVKAFLATSFDGGRHEKRINLLDQ
jgi:ribose 5-phosphate isomerase B